ncbi:hypothetical protein ACFWN1_14720 [Streptomyces sp. NPDC058459]|uniref:hypothetical protein n=1 Tax=Streptomyces sp. NPDC058459 TaxID=3346508 RepID=UPI003648F7F3
MPDTVPTTIVVLRDPQPPRYHHTDPDGDRLLITTADIPDTGPGVYFKTDPNGASIPLAEIPNLINRLREIADSRKEN